MGDARQEYFNRPDVWHAHHSEAEQRRALETAALLPEQGLSVLDVGAGSGIVGRALVASGGASVVSSDNALLPLSDAPGFRVAADCTALPFREHSVDASAACELMEHLDDEARGRTSLEMQRVTRRWIVATVPYRERYVSSLARCPHCSTVFHPNFHATSFDDDSFARMFEPAFRLRTMRLLGPPWPYVPSWVSQIAHKVGIYRSAPATAVCPGCGFARGVQSEGDSTPRDPSVRSIVKKFAPKNKATWYAGLFERAE